ncbi:MAG: tRNA pseudouridine(38-40) synthase TruA [Microbacteriaceae bacterium]
MVRLRLDIAYDGTDFDGWGTQPDRRTVQGEIENALATIFRCEESDVRLVVAGRTDAGVHATGQVAHFDCPDGMTPARLFHRLRSFLSAGDVVITAVTEAPEGFDARFSAIFRRYEYRVADGTVPRDPRNRRHTWWVKDELDIDRMNEAAQSLLGLRDWTTYCRPRIAATRVRELQEFSWRRDEAGVLVATIKADAFCHSMVRNLVGMCVAVGRGALEPADAMRLQEAKKRTSAFIVAKPHGLTFVEVGYPEASRLGERAESTRARRRLV